MLAKRQELIAAITALQHHLDGSKELSAKRLEADMAKIEMCGKVLFGSEEVIRAAINVVQTYDKVHGPMFLNDVKLKRVGEPGNLKPTETDIHWAVLRLMQQIVKVVYVPENLDRCADLLDGYAFPCAKDFPGALDPPSDPNVTHTVKVNASHAPLKGRAGNETLAREPTGTYLAPGSIATVAVPDALVGKGFVVRVGGHSRYHAMTRSVRRLKQISTTFPIESREVRVANPLGGGIYIEVPVKADAGVVEVSIRNAVRAPYFSAKSFDRTTLQQWREVERQHPAPWADLQSDRFMMLVPSAWIRQLDDPVSLVAEWDKAMDICNDLMGLPRVQGKEWLYISVDQQPMNTGQMKPGYPTSNHWFNPRKDAPAPPMEHLLQGPQYAPHWLFHELGHDYRFVKFWGDEETAVNLLYTAVLNKGFGVDLDTAFSRSKDERPFSTVDHAAVAWMTCTTFSEGLPMSTGLRRYQSHGFAKYVEIARLFGWDALGAFWSDMNKDHDVPERQPLIVANDVLILGMSKAAGADLTPLLKFWGAHPEKPEELKKQIAETKLPRSAKVYDTLRRYQSLVPSDNAAFRQFARNWWGGELKHDEKQVQSKNEHFEQWTAYNEQAADRIRQVIQSILDEFFPQGRPGDP